MDQTHSPEEDQRPTLPPISSINLPSTAWNNTRLNTSSSNYHLPQMQVSLISNNNNNNGDDIITTSTPAIKNIEQEIEQV